MSTEIQELPRASEFELKIPDLGGDSLRFMTASGLDLSIELEEIKCGPLLRGQRLVRGRPVPGRLQLAGGSGRLTQNIIDWITESLNPETKLQRRDVELKVFAADRKGELRTFTLLKAFPFSWSGPTLNTETDRVTIEHLSLAYESIVLGDRPKDPPVTYPSLKSKSGGSEVVFHAQPHSLSIRQDTKFDYLAGPGMLRPRPDFHHGHARTLKCQITTDWDIGEAAYRDHKNVYEQTDTVQSFMKPDPDSKEPPVLVFKYGAREFEGYLADLDIGVEKFTAEGVPLRVTYQFTLVESFEAKLPEDPGVF